MVNKSKRNKIKFRSTRKKYKGGQTTKKTWNLYANMPTVDERQIHTMGFEIPTDPGFESDKDCYKFMEMADRDLTVDMENKLNKYELVGGVGPNYCKYMYLIRATNPISGNTILHYICNRRSVEMFQLVFPYYLVLYNVKFPELLTYYINKKNKIGQTPLDLLANVKGNLSSGPMDYKARRIEGTFGTVKNAVSKLINLKKLSETLIRRAGNIGGRSGFIETILRKFGGKRSSEPADVVATSGPQNAIPINDIKEAALVKAEATVIPMATATDLPAAEATVLPVEQNNEFGTSIIRNEQNFTPVIRTNTSNGLFLSKSNRPEYNTQNYTPGTRAKELELPKGQRRGTVSDDRGVPLKTPRIEELL